MISMLQMFKEFFPYENHTNSFPNNVKKYLNSTVKDVHSPIDKNALHWLYVGGKRKGVHLWYEVDDVLIGIYRHMDSEYEPLKCEVLKRIYKGKDRIEEGYKLKNLNEEFFNNIYLDFFGKLKKESQ